MHCWITVLYDVTNPKQVTHDLMDGTDSIIRTANCRKSNGQQTRTHITCPLSVLNSCLRNTPLWWIMCACLGSDWDKRNKLETPAYVGNTSIFRVCWDADVIGFLKTTNLSLCCHYSYFWYTWNLISHVKGRTETGGDREEESGEQREQVKGKTEKGAQWWDSRLELL